MKIAVLGGAGYIGGAITAHLAYRGHDVTVIGSPRRFPDLQAALSVYAYKDKVVYRASDFRTEQDFGSLLGGYDAIVHSAGPSGEGNCQTDAYTAVMAHIAPLYTLRKFQRVIFLSSFHLYRGNTAPFDEEMEILPDGNLYRALKHAGEQLIQGWTAHTILRLPHVYGLGLGYAVDPKGFIASCVAQCLEKWEVMPLTNMGELKWQFLHLYDLVRIVEYAIEKYQNGVFNVGNPQPAKLKDVVTLTARIADTPIPTIAPRPKSWRKTLSQDMFMDVSRSRSALGWGQSILMEQGIREMIVNYDRWKK